jgi:hypothetical protein
MPRRKVAKLRRKLVPEIFREELRRQFKVFIEPLMEAYVEPTRTGTRRGQPVGMSREKYLCAQAMALHSEISELYPLSEICAFICGSNTSVEMVRKWRTESHFKQVARQAARAFASFIIDEILRSENYYTHEKYHRVMILIESLVLLPGFFLTDNKFIWVMRVLDDEIRHNPQDKENYSKLLNCITAYRDVLRIYMDMLQDNEREACEDEVDNIVRPILNKVDFLVEEAWKKDFITDDMATAIGAIQMSLTFIMSYSKVVI